MFVLKIMYIGMLKSGRVSLVAYPFSVTEY
jgi:hypothetical protein